MDWLILAVFLVVYIGMMLGRLPGLALDRTGIALLGAIVLLAFGRVMTNELQQAVDIPTISLLFGLMILSAQFRLAGTYSFLVRAIGKISLSPEILMATIVFVTAVLSAVLINDIVCFALTPVIVEICCRRRLDPIPFLLAIAAASNIGSAATLIGNPQNILIGQTMALSFSSYLYDSIVPVILSLAGLWVIITLQYRKIWHISMSYPVSDAPAFSLWQTAKGAIITILLLIIFLGGFWPRDLVTLAAAAVMLCSRRMRSREILGIIDWQLLVLFVSLFIINFALNNSGTLAKMETALFSAGINMHNPAWLFVGGALLSNIVSNVPAVMLLLPFDSDGATGPILALSSTFAGNFIIIGSIANIIVVDQAARLGINIGWRRHAATGIPVTLFSLAVAALWLWLRA